jgi:hypothetical protein
MGSHLLGSIAFDVYHVSQGLDDATARVPYASPPAATGAPRWRAPLPLARQLPVRAYVAGARRRLRRSGRAGVERRTARAPVGPARSYPEGQ